MQRHAIWSGLYLAVTTAAQLGCSDPSSSEPSVGTLASSDANTEREMLRAVLDLEPALSASVSQGDTAGAVGLIVDREGLLFEGAAGLLDVANNTPMTVDAIFNIASMTKPVTSVAIMMLREQGLLDLNDPVSDYLPGFDAPEVLTAIDPATDAVETVAATNVMTIRHLLSHTSGLAYAFSNSTIETLQEGNELQEWELPLLNEPGTRWNYSPSTRVLGLIVEDLSGQSLEEFFQQNIFSPLGMSDTSFAIPTDKSARLPTLHIRTTDGGLMEVIQAGIPSTPTPPFTGDGGLYSTARDYGQFMRMFLNGGTLDGAQILTESSLMEMGTNQIGDNFVELQESAIPALTNEFPLGAGVDKFGLGFQISQSSTEGEGRRVGSLAWAGLFNTEFWIDPDTGIAATLLMQVLPFYDEGALRSLQQFESSLYQQLSTQ